MKVILGSDHAGIAGRKEAVRLLRERGWEVQELGPEGDSEKADYPDIAHQIAQSVTSSESEMGVLVCGTGQGMAMKLLNNFLSGMAMAATSEAIAFGARQGLDMATIIDTVSVSSGTNTAITDKFPKRILSESFDSGFATRLMTKDLQLYVDSCKQLDAPRRLSETLLEQVWGQMLVDMPASDFTEIYPFTLTRDK